MKIVRASASLLSLTEAEFPRTLSDAMEIANLVPILSDSKELWLTLEEPIKAELDGLTHSAELLIQQWGFRLIAEQWVPIRVLDGESFDLANLKLLTNAFKTAAKAAKALANRLYLENSTDVATIFYGFDWPHTTLFTTYVPAEIYAECKKEALSLGYQIHFLT